MDETQKICPNCRKPLPPDVPMGLCPECLIKSGFPTGTAPGAAAEVAGARFVPPPVAEIAALFPQLEIIRLIGQGGMGAVYKARQPSLDRFVALKVLPPAAASDPGFAERFNREARALARLNHPNIVAVHDFGKSGPLHYLLMEFVDGTNLREVERSGELTREQALAIVPQICEALQFAHNEGIVHRDIKPENLLLDKKGRLKITDFGIAKMVGVGPSQQMLTGAKDIVGTPHYMAPEQIEKPQAVDHRADIYSLGVVFYEMLTGELPLGKFSPPSKKVQVDVRLDEVVLRALEKEPARRYQQASQVKTDVETIAGTFGPGANPGAAPSTFSAQDPAASDKAILPAFLLAFFFGVFGAHRFYVGKIGSGLLQLGAFGTFVLLIIACANGGPEPAAGILLGFVVFGCVIWATVDWILIACGAFRDSHGRRMSHWLHAQNGISRSASRPAITPPSGPQPHGAASPSGLNPEPPTTIKTPAAPATSTGFIVAPAVALMVAALWKFLSAVTALFLLAGTNTSWLSNKWMGPVIPGLDANLLSHWSSLAIFSILIFKVVPALLIFIGGLQMLRLRSYAWALAAAILSVVTCSLIGLPIGVWALIVLAREDVRQTFANATRSASPGRTAWAWVLGVTLLAGVLALAALALNRHFSSTPNVTISGIVTDAATGQPIAGARIDDNRYGTGPGEPPAQAWTDTKGHYELKTRYEEHSIAASANGYESKLSTLRTKIFHSERDVRMNFALDAQASPLTMAAGTTRDLSAPEAALSVQTVTTASGNSSSTSAVVNARSAHAFQPVRIKAGSSDPLVDHEGNLWLPDQDFVGGETTERPNLAIANTTDPELYQSERYGATSFSYPVPDGRYQVRLHFAETYESMMGPNQRVFTFVVEGREFRDFDVWAEAGGAQRACVKTVNVEVSDGTLNINFIPERQNPEINAIEILPAPAGPGTPIAPRIDGNSSLTTNISSTTPQMTIGNTNGGALTLPAPKAPAAPTVTAGPKDPPAPKPPGLPGTISAHQGIAIGILSTTDPFQQSFARTLPLSAKGQVRLDNVSGRIEIAGWDRNEVAIRALKHGKVQESVETVKINVTSSPDEILIHTEMPHNENGFSWSRLWSGNWAEDNAVVDYALQVPHNVKLKSVSSVNGNIVIEDVLGDIEASTVNGKAQITGAAGSLKLSSVNGRIDAGLNSLDRGQSVSLSTVNGHIEATLPSTANARVSATTVNGGISSDFPALVVSKEFPLSSKLKGTLGNGDANVTASSVNGRINFRRSADD